MRLVDPRTKTNLRCAAWLGAALGLPGACAPAAPVTERPQPPAAAGTAAPSASGLPAVSSAASPTGAAPAVEPPAVAPSADGEVDNSAGTIEADGPAAPCDFARLYRGRVGDTRASVLLARAGAGLRGHSAYDSGFGDLPIAGSVEPDGSVVLTERKGGQVVGTFRGHCDPSSGILRGQWERGAERKPFELRPREAGGVGLVERVRAFGEVRDDEPSCSWNVRSPAVFGLGDDARTARINRALQVRFVGANETEWESLVRRCPQGTDNHVAGWYSIEANDRGLLSVVHNGYTYFGPAVHGDFTAAAAAISIDVPTGRTLAFQDVFASRQALRPLVHSCMRLASLATSEPPAPGKGIEIDDGWWWERAIQGFPSDQNGDPAEEGSREFDPRSVYEPSFLVLDDGVAVLIRNQPTVSAAFELTGPVMRWGALKRAGVLARSSPIARLWAAEPILAETEATCVRYFAPKWSPIRKSAAQRIAEGAAALATAGPDAGTP